MPARPVQHEKDTLGWPCSHFLSEGRQHLTEELGGDGGEEPPDGLTGGGTDEATDVEPLVALLHRGNRALADRGPDPSDQRQESNAMLIGRPELDLRLRMRCLDRRDLVRQIFFEGLLRHRIGVRMAGTGALRTHPDPLEVVMTPLRGDVIAAGLGGNPAGDIRPGPEASTRSRSLNGSG